MTHRSPSTFRAALALLFFVIIGFASIAHAQTETASIRGSVTDPTGAVVRDATVRLMTLIADLKPKWQPEVAAFIPSPVFVPAITAWKWRRAGSNWCV